jgi:hypothetical protein
MDDGEEKLAAFFREMGMTDTEGSQPQNASIRSRRERIPWKLISVFLFLVFVVWNLMH